MLGGNPPASAAASAGPTLSRADPQETALARVRLLETVDALLKSRTRQLGSHDRA